MFDVISCLIYEEQSNLITLIIYVGMYCTLPSKEITPLNLYNKVPLCDIHEFLTDNVDSNVVSNISLFIPKTQRLILTGADLSA